MADEELRIKNGYKNQKHSRNQSTAEACAKNMLKHLRQLQNIPSYFVHLEDLVGSRGVE